MHRVTNSICLLRKIDSPHAQKAEIIAHERTEPCTKRSGHTQSTRNPRYQLNDMPRSSCVILRQHSLSNIQRARPRQDLFLCKYHGRGAWWLKRDCMLHAALNFKILRLPCTITQSLMTTCKNQATHPNPRIGILICSVSTSECETCNIIAASRAGGLHPKFDDKKHNATTSIPWTKHRFPWILISAKRFPGL